MNSKEIVELQITGTGIKRTYSLNSQEIKLLEEVLKWFKVTYFGDFNIKKEGKKLIVVPKQSLVIKEEETN